MQPITTTLRAIRQCGLTIDYKKLVKFLGKDYGNETSIRFSQIVESNGVDDAYWCLRALPEEHDNEVRLLLADVAERVLHIYEAVHPNCKKPRQAIEASRAFARGEIGKEELSAAVDAAVYAARAAELAAAWDAEVFAAGDTVWDAAELAALAAAWAAAARDAAWGAARGAAWGAARGAALDAARDAAWAAALDAARDAALDAEHKAQAELLIKRFG